MSLLVRRAALPGVAAILVAAACADLSYLQGGTPVVADDGGPGLDAAQPPPIDVPDAARSADATVDAPFDAGTDALVSCVPLAPEGTGFCPTAGNVSFCSDFDRGSPTFGFTTNTADPGAWLNYGCSGSSNPAALRATAAVAAPGGRAFVRSVFGSPLYSSVSLDFKWFPRTFSTGSSATIARLGVSNTADGDYNDAVYVTIQGSELDDKIDVMNVTGTGATSYAPFFMGYANRGEWTRVRITVTWTGTNFAVTSAIGNGALAAQPATTSARTSDAPNVAIGFVRPAVGPLMVDFDDVVTTVQ